MFPLLCVHLRSSAIVPAARVEQVDYFHLELATHDVIFAEGAAAESFIDDGGRSMFHNEAEYRALYPAASATNTGCCAPRVGDGLHVAAVRQRIAALARKPAA